MHEVVVGIEDGAVVRVDGGDAVRQLMHARLAQHHAIRLPQSGYEGIVPQRNVACSTG